MIRSIGRALGLTVLSAVLGGCAAQVADPLPAAATQASAASAVPESLPPGFQASTVGVNRSPLHFVTGGTGTPTLLLPDWPQGWQQFHEVMPALAAHFHLIAVDLRGTGQSAALATDLGDEALGRDLYELVRHLGFNKVNIVTQGAGAYAAYRFANRYPEAVLKIVMLEPHTPAVADAAHREPAADWYRAFMQSTLATAADRKLEAPVLGLAATDSPELRGLLSRLAAHVELRVVADGGNRVLLAQPEATVKQVVEYLD